MTTRPVYDSQFDTVYYYCPGCGFLFIEGDKIPPPGQEKERYLKHINSPDERGYVEMLEDFLRRGVTAFGNDIRTALDFGCGPGPVLAGLLKEMGIEVDVYDIYFFPGKAYEVKTYDLITCTEVLEHVRDPLAMLSRLKNHLNRGGLLAVMTLFHPVGEAGGDEVFNRWWYRRDPTHISFFCRKTFETIAQQLGLSIRMMDNKNTVTFQRL